MDKRLFKSKTDKKICGVCAGIANYFDIDPTIIRLIWALTVVFAGSGIWVYFICALVIPDEPDQADDQNANNVFNGTYFTNDK